MKYIISLLVLIFMTGCSAVDMEQYSSNSPKLDLFDYFIGETKGYGIVQDRKGTLTRQFTVDITGIIQADGSLNLYEKFDWSDGEKSTRTWKISKKTNICTQVQLKMLLALQMVSPMAMC